MKTEEVSFHPVIQSCSRKCGQGVRLLTYSLLLISSFQNSSLNQCFPKVCLLISLRRIIRKLNKSSDSWIFLQEVCSIMCVVRLGISIFTFFAPSLWKRCPRDIQNTFWMFYTPLTILLFWRFRIFSFTLFLSHFSNPYLNLLVQLSFTVSIFSQIYYALLSVRSYMDAFVLPYLETFILINFVWSQYFFSFFFSF